MKPHHTLAASLMLSPFPAVTYAADSTIERTLQSALEGVQSGTVMTARSADAQTNVTARPLRTWKSVSGHYCREYELRIMRIGQATLVKTGTRCRSNGGIWKEVES